MPTPQQTQIDEKIRREMTDILSSLLIRAQELGFELATCDCEHANKCPVVLKSRELIRELKRLFELQKKLRS